MKKQVKKYTIEEFKKMLEDAEIKTILNPVEGLNGASELGENEKLLFCVLGSAFLSQIKKILFDGER